MTNKVDGSRLSHEVALEIIKSQSGTRYDPKIVDAFLSLYKE